MGPPRRASTFPEAMPNSRLATANSLPLSQAHLANLGVDPRYGQSSIPGSEPYDPTPSLTPTSATPSGASAYGGAPTHLSHPQLAQSFPATPLTNNFVDPTGLNVPISDVNAMMFPTADPFAYPNQPMTTFENNNPQDFGIKSETSPTSGSVHFPVSNMGIKSQPAVYPPGSVNMGAETRRPTENDVQLFGPMPMYLMHGAQQQGQRAFHPHAPRNMQLGSTPEGAGVSFDELFGGEQWANTFMDEGLGLSGNSSGYGGPSPQFHPAPGPGMPGWRYG